MGLPRRVLELPKKVLELPQGILGLPRRLWGFPEGSWSFPGDLGASQGDPGAVLEALELHLGKEKLHLEKGCGKGLVYGGIGNPRGYSLE